MRPLADCRLYTFVDLAWLGGRSPETVARELCAGGADILQLRAKGLPVGPLTELAERLAPIAREAGVWFVINDHPDVARAVGAPVCHLGQEDFFDAGWRHVSQVAPPGPGSLQVGLSSHEPSQALRAVAAGAAYVAIGPVYPTPTKPGRPAVTLDYVRWAAAHLTVPWFAIGGVNLETLDAVLAAGARRVCVVSAILQAPDIAGACREFRWRLLSAPA